MGAIGGYFFWCVATLPEVASIDSVAPFESTELYSYDNKLLAEFYTEKRTYIPHELIPQYVKNAFIAVEDKRFYGHIGIDPVRIVGALLSDIKAMAFVEGGSTITQQLAKMIFLTPEKTVTRKIKEIALSLKLEKRFTKDELIGMYLNHLYLGLQAYGIESAAQTYFNKKTTEISIPEAALLATLPRAPSRYSDFSNHEQVLEKRNSALYKMYLQGFISAEQYQESIDAPLSDRPVGRELNAPYYVDYVRGVLEQKYGERLYTSGMKIYTTLDFALQKAAERAVARGCELLKERNITGVQIALVAADIATGRIKAMVGGTGYDITQFNRATQAKRQPGSAFKPIVYLTALNEGYTPDDIIDDRKLTYKLKEGIWTPQNYGHVYYGKVSLEDALTRSLNAATVNLARRIGMSRIIETAQSLGITSTIHPYYSSALGASELSLLELVIAYASFSQGYRVQPVPVDRIIERDQITIFDPPRERDENLSPEVVGHIRSMLRSVVLNGTARRAAKMNRKAYGKTGTSNDCADAWFIGFDDEIIAGVWVGRDDRKPIGKNETGGRTALPIWIDFMNSAEHNTTEKILWSDAGKSELRAHAVP